MAPLCPLSYVSVYIRVLDTMVLGSRILQNTPMRVLTGGASGRVVYFLAIDGSNGSALMKVGMDGWEIVSGWSLFHSTTVLLKNEFAKASVFANCC